MRHEKRPYPLFYLCENKANINTNPDYQRPAVWDLSTKQLLIDTILRDYDIPKIYLKQKEDEKFDVIDGQQRIRAIWSFKFNEFKLPKDMEDIEGFEVKNKNYEELPPKLKQRFGMYNVDTIIVREFRDEDEIKEMFLRLQNGITLKAQEKRNAMPGNMRNFIKELSTHVFFTEIIPFKNRRFFHDQVCAQITLIESEGGINNITGIQNKPLNNLYLNNKEFDENGSVAKKIKKNLDVLKNIFLEKTPELDPHYVITLYAMISHLLERYIITERLSEIKNWFLEFEKYRQVERKKPSDECDPEILGFQDKVTHASDSKSAIGWRFDFMLDKLLIKLSNLQKKDEDRSFNNEQRKAIWRKNKGICQLKIKCEGIKISWDNFHADHIIPHSRGGETTVENGQVACPECNLSKSNSMQ